MADSELAAPPLIRMMALCARRLLVTDYCTHSAETPVHISTTACPKSPNPQEAYPSYHLQVPVRPKGV